MAHGVGEDNVGAEGVNQNEFNQFAFVVWHLPKTQMIMTSLKWENDTNFVIFEFVKICP